MTKVFVIILNWNRKKLTLECLKSIDKLTVTGFELHVLVVDNASTDGSISAFRKFKAKKFEGQIIKNTDNLGYAAGNNAGIKNALTRGADFIMILNNDTIVDKHLLTDLLKVARSHPKAGLLSPKIYFAKGYEFHKKRYKKGDLGKVIWYAGGDIDWANVYGANHGVDQADRGQFDKIDDTDFATGTCMLLRRKAIKKVGMFDEKYFMYLEDADLSMRMKRKGWEVIYAPPARLWHKVAQSSSIGSDLNDYYITRNRLLFGGSYAPMRARFALFREGVKLFLSGRPWQKAGIRDYFLGNFWRGTFK